MNKQANINTKLLKIIRWTSSEQLYYHCFYTCIICSLRVNACFRGDRAQVSVDYIK